MRTYDDFLMESYQLREKMVADKFDRNITFYRHKVVGMTSMARSSSTVGIISATYKR